MKVLQTVNNFSSVAINGNNMNKILRILKFSYQPEKQIRIRKPWFSKFYKNSKSKYLEYKYWIEFRIDEGRFFYGETKPVLVNPNKNIYEYQTNYIHTKQGLDGSLSILTEISNRFSEINENEITNSKWKKELWQISNIKDYRMFDKKN